MTAQRGSRCLSPVAPSPGRGLALEPPSFDLAAPGRSVGDSVGVVGVMGLPPCETPRLSPSPSVDTAPGIRVPSPTVLLSPPRPPPALLPLCAAPCGGWCSSAGSSARRRPLPCRQLQPGRPAPSAAVSPPPRRPGGDPAPPPSARAGRAPAPAAPAPRRAASAPPGGRCGEALRRERHEGLRREVGGCAPQPRAAPGGRAQGAAQTPPSRRGSAALRVHFSDSGGAEPPCKAPPEPPSRRVSRVSAGGNAGASPQRPPPPPAAPPAGPPSAARARARRRAAERRLRGLMRAAEGMCARGGAAAPLPGCGGAASAPPRVASSALPPRAPLAPEGVGQVAAAVERLWRAKRGDVLDELAAGHSEGIAALRAATASWGADAERSGQLRWLARGGLPRVALLAMQLSSEGPQLRPLSPPPDSPPEQKQQQQQLFAAVWSGRMDSAGRWVKALCLLSALGLTWRQQGGAAAPAEVSCAVKCGSGVARAWAGLRRGEGLALVPATPAAVGPPQCARPGTVRLAVRGLPSWLPSPSAPGGADAWGILPMLQLYSVDDAPRAPSAGGAEGLAVGLRWERSAMRAAFVQEVLADARSAERRLQQLDAQLAQRLSYYRGAMDAALDAVRQATAEVEAAGGRARRGPPPVRRRGSTHSAVAEVGAPPPPRRGSAVRSPEPAVVDAVPSPAGPRGPSAATQTSRQSAEAEAARPQAGGGRQRTAEPVSPPPVEGNPEAAAAAAEAQRLREANAALAARVELLSAELEAQRAGAVAASCRLASAAAASGGPGFQPLRPAPTRSPASPADSAAPVRPASVSPLPPLRFEGAFLHAPTVLLQRQQQCFSGASSADASTPPPAGCEAPEAGGDGTLRDGSEAAHDAAEATLRSSARPGGSFSALDRTRTQPDDTPSGLPLMVTTAQLPQHAIGVTKMPSVLSVSTNLDTPQKETAAPPPSFLLATRLPLPLGGAANAAAAAVHLSEWRDCAESWLALPIDPGWHDALGEDGRGFLHDALAQDVAAALLVRPGAIRVAGTGPMHPVGLRVCVEIEADDMPAARALAARCDELISRDELPLSATLDTLHVLGALGDEQPSG